MEKGWRRDGKGKKSKKAEKVRARLRMWKIFCTFARIIV